MIYEYTEEVKREREVKPCPCCGSEDLYFWNEDRDESMHWSSALVKCRNCGHMVRIDGNDVKDPVGSGRYCQMRAIDEWNSQYERFGKRNEPIDSCVEDIRKEVEALREENYVLKQVALLEDFRPKVIRPEVTYGGFLFDAPPERIELIGKWYEIMSKFREEKHADKNRDNDRRRTISV